MKTIVQTLKEFEALPGVIRAEHGPGDGVVTVVVIPEARSIGAYLDPGGAGAGLLPIGTKLVVEVEGS